MTYYRRRDMTDEEWALAGALGVAVGAATFYLARIWMQRETLSEGLPGPAEPEAGLEAGPEAEPEAKREAADPDVERQAREPDVESEVEGAERPLR